MSRPSTPPSPPPPENDIGQSHFDVTVVGTGLSESIAASTLAKQGYSVLHLDPHEYYGDRHASLTVDEMVQWVKEIQAASLPRYTAASYESPASDFEDNLDRVARQYALSVFPAILPARGDLIDTLIAEDVAKYVSFRLVDGVSTYQKPSAGEPKGNGKWKRVPAGKDQIFKDSSLSLLEKRRLMKFIMFASAERDSDGWNSEPVLQGKESQSLLEFLATTFQLSHELADTIAYGIAFCTSPSESVKPALLRMNRYFRSIGRYGPSPFLIAQYGGVGEITQAFCRACAVYGGMYILGPQSKITNFTCTPEATQSNSKHAISIQIPAHHEPVTSKVLIDGTGTLSRHSSQAKQGDAKAALQNCCIAILSKLPSQIKLAITPQTDKRDDDSDSENAKEEQTEENTQDVFLMVFPPASIEGGSSQAVRALFTGSGTGSCPTGQFILYLQAMAEGDSPAPKQTLLPYMECLLGDTSPLFITYYATQGTSDPLLFSSGVTDGSTGTWASSGSGQGESAWLEGLDLEARRAQDLIRRGLAANSTPTRNVSTEQD
ncbi:hypothetical protein QFC21_000366 [Naganishia friedmannii]|uniref:Uncharacterized protein n=1 Tax=Naganishia friedmannii TaxID=89922 RepID=A0ACC2WCH5_9TREE|nr:hypothetical protein QFC21_000366 [Naganishia friedmannii]